jgi:hypothetical protein
MNGQMFDAVVKCFEYAFPALSRAYLAGDPDVFGFVDSFFRFPQVVVTACRERCWRSLRSTQAIASYSSSIGSSKSNGCPCSLASDFLLCLMRFCCLVPAVSR